MSHSAELVSPRIADELCAMQSNLISIENICNKNSALCSIAQIREYLREFETEYENILVYYSGA
jgi:hypothetical protein